MEHDKMNIQWYPGHMTKTRRQIEADLKQVDAVCEIVDARIPASSRNPDIDAICGKKPRIVILNRMERSIIIWSPADGWGIAAMTNGYTIKDTDIIQPLANGIVAALE